MKHNAPIIPGPLEFAGLSNNIVLVEHNDSDNSLSLLAPIINGKVNIIFTPDEDFDSTGFESNDSAVIFCNSISMVCKIAKRLPSAADYMIVNRVDMFDIHFDKKERGAQVKAYISMMAGAKTLRGANLIVTSGRTEYALRGVADRLLNLN